MTTKFLRACLQALFWIVVTTNFALAATAASLAPSTSMPLDQALLSFVICTFSGVAALLRRIDKELKVNPGALPRPALFCAMHLFGSWLAGGLAFVISQQQHFDVWAEVGLMIVASYIGAAWVEAFAEKVSPATPKEDMP